MNYAQAQRLAQTYEKELTHLFTTTLHGHTETLGEGGPLPCTDSSDPKKQTTVLYTSGFIATGLDPDFAVTRRVFAEHWEKKGWHAGKSSVDDRHVEMTSPDNFTVRLDARPQTGEAVYEVDFPLRPQPGPHLRLILRSAVFSFDLLPTSTHVDRQSSSRPHLSGSASRDAGDRGRFRDTPDRLHGEQGLCTPR